jgi:hypothetical protein
MVSFHRFKVFLWMMMMITTTTTSQSRALIEKLTVLGPVRPFAVHCLAHNS